jgi:hypothetical protein
MIHLTHIQKCDEVLMMKQISKFIVQKYPNLYFEIKCFHNGINTSPSNKFNSRDFSKLYSNDNKKR